MASYRVRKFTPPPPTGIEPRASTAARLYAPNQISEPHTHAYDLPKLLVTFGKNLIIVLDMVNQKERG